MATEVITQSRFSVPIKCIALIELDNTMQFYEIHLTTDEPQDPSLKSLQ
jgi:hypothetical protein